HLLYVLLNDRVIEEVVVNSGGNIKNIKKDCEMYFSMPEMVSGNKINKPKETTAFNRTLQRAATQSVVAEAPEEINLAALLLSLLSEDDSHAFYFLTSNGTDRESLVKALKKKSESTQQENSLKSFLKNLNEEFQKGNIDPVIGRNSE